MAEMKPVIPGIEDYNEARLDAAETRAQVAALTAERDAARAELAAAKQHAEGLEHACEVINQIAGDDFCEDLEMRAANGSMADTDIGIAQKKLSAVYRAAHSATKRSCFSAHEDWREEVVKAIDAARAPEGTEGKDKDGPTPQAKTEERP